MAGEWLYSREGTDYGPVSSSELMELAKNGQLLPTDLLWKEGMAEWKPASSFPKLCPPQASADEMPVFVVNDKKPKVGIATGKSLARKATSTPKAQARIAGGKKRMWMIVGGVLFGLIIVGGMLDEDSKDEKQDRTTTKSSTVRSRDRQSEGWQEGVRNGEYWASKYEKGLRNGENPLVMQKYKESMQEVADNYLRLVRNHERTIAQFTQFGQEVPPHNVKSLQHCEDQYRGFMEKAGEYLR